RLTPSPTIILFPYTTLFRSQAFGRKFRVSLDNLTGDGGDGATFKDNVYAQVQRYFDGEAKLPRDAAHLIQCICSCTRSGKTLQRDRKSTRLNSSHVSISYAV